MLVYHGSIQKVEDASIKYSRKNMDFGCGFYVTKIKKQAKIWAQRKKLILNKKTAYINIYELNKEYTECNYKLFQKADSEWLDFVCNCREGKAIYKKYDVIEGPVANDKVYTVVDMYRKGLWDKDKTLKDLKFYKVSNQICLVRQKIIDKYLRYVKCEEIEDGE